MNRLSPLLPALLALLAVACDKDEESTETPEVEEVPELPVLRIDAPARAAFLGQQQVTIQGQVRQGSYALTTLEANEQAISWQGNGAIDQAWTPDNGLNLLGFRLEDEGDQRAVDGRAFVWGPVSQLGEPITGGVRILLGPDLSELAGLIELVLQDDSLADSFVGQPMEGEYAEITPTRFAWSGADVALQPTNGALQGSFTLYNVEMDFHVQGVDWYDWVETDGTAWMSSLQLDASMALSVSGGQVRAMDTQVTATMQGFGFEADWVPFESWLYDWVGDYVESSLEDEVAAMLEELVPEYLNGLAMDTSFGKDPPIYLSLSMNSADVTSSGIRLEMDATAWSDVRVELPEGAGSVMTESEPPDWSEASGGSFAVLADDDFVNQLLYASWAAGLLSNMSISSIEMTALSGGEMEPPLGPVDSVGMNLGLPPVIEAPVQEDMQLNLSLGELRVAFHREDGITHDFSVNVSTGATVAIDGDDELTMSLDDRPAYVEVYVGVLEYDPALDPGDLAALMRLILPPLLGSASDWMPGYAIPPVELGDLTDMEALADVSLEIRDPSISLTEQGWVLLRGEFAAQ